MENIPPLMLMSKISGLDMTELGASFDFDSVLDVFERYTTFCCRREANGMA